MTFNIGIYLFNEFTALDAVGPWDVFSYAAKDVNNIEVMMITKDGKSVHTDTGLTVMAHKSIDEVKNLDLLIIPGGLGTRQEINDTKVINWIKEVTKDSRYITSVCTGVLLLEVAGFAVGKRVTTYHAFVETLESRGKVSEVISKVSFVKDGNLVTSAGVSGGIDMSLWLVGQLWGKNQARKTRSRLQYEPSPPYTSELDNDTTGSD
jgi:transcriptional regulator GlxA family with amidase domain